MSFQVKVRILKSLCFCICHWDIASFPTCKNFFEISRDNNKSNFLISCNKLGQHLEDRSRRGCHKPSIWKNCSQYLWSAIKWSAIKYVPVFTFKVNKKFSSAGTLATFQVLSNHTWLVDILDLVDTKCWPVQISDILLLYFQVSCFKMMNT